MSEAKMGAMVIYCGHTAVFMADIFKVGNVNVVKANGPINKNLLRRPEDLAHATHHVSDFPVAGCWDPNRGFFVVPAKQVKELSEKQRKKLQATYSK